MYVFVYKFVYIVYILYDCGTNATSLLELPSIRMQNAANNWVIVLPNSYKHTLLVTPYGILIF